MADDGQEVIRVRDCLGGWVIEGRALVGEGTEEYVIDRVPSEWAGYLTLWYSSVRREEDVIVPECLET